MNVAPVNLWISVGSNKEDLMKKPEEILPDIIVEEESVNEGVFSWYLPEDGKFIKIDREQEDKDVIRYQKTGDREIFERLYQNRIPSLQIWARRHHYLTDSKENMFGELRFYFMKAVLKFKKNRGSFNTCLFTFLLNCIRNLKTGKKAKKRKPEGADPNSMNNFVLSLDYSYGNVDEGDGRSLKDILSDKMEDRRGTVDQIYLEETMNVLSNKNHIIKKFLRGLSDGNTLGNMIKTFKTKKGIIKISRKQFKNLSSKKSKKTVIGLIKDHNNIEDKFSLIGYSVHAPNILNYTIEMQKTKESDLIIKTVRKLRRNKESILERIHR